MRLVIFVEGDTEERTIKDFLEPYFTEFEQVEVLNTRGNGNIISGDRLTATFKRDAETALEDENTIVVCLIDMKEIGLGYPKYVHEDADPQPAQYKYIQKFMRERVRADFRERFYPFPMVHEYETWLLADLEALRAYFSPDIQPYSAPESVLDPIKELEKIANEFRSGRRKEYHKIRDGVALFNRADAQRVYDDNCPHFEDLINTLLEVQGIKPARQSLEFTIPNQELFTRLDKLVQQQEDLWQAYETVCEDLSPDEDDAYEKQFQAIDEAIAAVEAEIKRLNENE